MNATEIRRLVKARIGGYTMPAVYSSNGAETERYYSTDLPRLKYRELVRESKLLIDAISHAEREGYLLINCDGGYEPALDWLIGRLYKVNGEMRRRDQI